MRKLLYLLCALASATWAAAPLPLTIDARIGEAPLLQLYRASGRDISVSFKDGGVALNLTNQTPWLAWATNATSAMVCTSTVSSFVGYSTGLVTFAWTGADLNYAPGRYVYYAGVSQGTTVSVYRAGTLLLQGSPYTAGAVPWSTQMVYSAYTWIGVPWVMSNDVAALATNSPTLAQWQGSNATLAAAYAAADVVVSAAYAAADTAASNALRADLVGVINSTGTLLAAAQIAGDTNTLGQAKAYTDVATGGVWGVTQYPLALLTNGTRAMGANLPMGGQSITNLLNIQMGGYWQAVSGAGTSTIDPTAYGANQSGINAGTQTIGGGSYGSRQIGNNVGTRTIGLGAFGASQQGANAGTQTIEDTVYGASQIGNNLGTQTIGTGADGASQSGHTEATATAINNAIGAMQLLDLTAGQNALTTTNGAGSILLGAGGAGHRYAIVAGDGAVSHGDGSITAAGGFYGNASGLYGDASSLTALSAPQLTGNAPTGAVTNAVALLGLATVNTNWTLAVASQGWGYGRTGHGPTAANVVVPTWIASRSATAAAHWLAWTTAETNQQSQYVYAEAAPCARGIAEVRVRWWASNVTDSCTIYARPFGSTNTWTASCTTGVAGVTQTNVWTVSTDAAFGAAPYIDWESAVYVTAPSASAYGYTAQPEIQWRSR